MRERPARILLIQNNPDDVRLMEEAFAEIEETRYSHAWVNGFTLILADGIAEAVSYLERERFDAILLDLDLSDCDVLPAFLRLRSEMAETPVVALCGAADENVAVSLLRQGAQDYVIKTELDCVPLARSLRNAIERNRLTAARQSVSLTDDLTGLYNGRGFRHLACRHMHLADRHGLSAVAAMIDVAMSSRKGDPDLALLGLSEAIRGMFAPADLVGRIGRWRFAALSLAGTAGDAVELAGRVDAGVGKLEEECQVSFAIREAGRSEDVDGLLARAEMGLSEPGLCENKAV